MNGLSQQLKERSRHKSSSWNFLESLVDSNRLSYIDFALAERILRDIPGTTEAVAALICHISAAARQGHLCIKVNDNEVYPDPASCWSETDSTELMNDEDTFDKAKMLIQQGALQLPSCVLTDVSCMQPTFKSVNTPIVRMGNLFYFQRFWYYEKSFLEHYKQFLTYSLKITMDENSVLQHVQSMERLKSLLPEQAQAIIKACKSTLTIICGGPGTGKTYTAGQLIRILWDSLQNATKQTFEIALAAPTGKAAANLQKSLQKACENIPALHAIQAKTLHNLLGIRGSKTTLELPSITADLIIVDECSMIDVQLMGTLFAALKPGARLVLLGDNHQLPAVEAGALFADLIQTATSKSTTIVNKLHVCLRAELQGILELASAVNEGNTEKAVGILNSKEQGVQRLSFGSTQKPVKEIQKLICTHALPHYRVSLKPGEELEELIHFFNTFRILSPLRKGPFGVEEINRTILKELQKDASKNTPFAAPIILLKNDYRLDLFNGETGVLIRQSFESDVSQGDYALFPGRNGEGIRKVPALLLPPFEYAYCLSVHKSQGSEFDHVVLLLPSGSEKFGREVLYTAITRARRKLEIYAEDEILEETIRKQSHRLSGLGAIVDNSGQC